jgi:streptogramin lyase
MGVVAAWIIVVGCTPLGTATGRPEAGGGGPTATESAAASSIQPDHGTVVRVDAVSGHVEAVYATGEAPFILAVAGGTVWTQDFGDASLTMIQPVRGASQQVDLGEVAGIVGDRAHLWVALDGNMIVKVDGGNGRVISAFRMAEIGIFDRRQPGFLGVGGGSVWLVVPGSSGDTERCWRIDPETGEVQATIPIGGEANPPVADDDFLWVVTRSDHGLARIDLATNEAVDIPVDPFPWSLVSDAGSVWIGHHGRRPKVVRIDSQTLDQLAVIPFETNPRGLAAGGGRVWAAAEDGLYAIDPATNEVAFRVDLGTYERDTGPIGIAYADDSVWVSIE